MPRVTVVTTTLNRVDFLAQAIQSALAQTFTDLELLVCDDGGLGATRELCRNFQDPRMRHIVNPSPLGVAMNTYTGVMAANSDLIAFLNDDDRWTPNFLERCARPLIENERAVLAFSDHWIIDAAGKRLVAATDNATRTYCRDVLAPGHIKEPVRLIAHNSIPLAMASVFRKSAVDWTLYSRNVGGAYDYFLSYCLLRSGGEVFYVPERLTEYRVHDGSASAKFKLTHCLGSAYVNGLILRDPRFASISLEIRPKCVSLERHLARLCFRQRKFISAMKHLTSSVRYGAT